jgi:hypothetical protein
MANYTIDDIEILRKKSGITYEEAVNLLEYHNGNLARSLVDLEKNGRLKNDGPQTRATGGRQSGLKKLFNTLYRTRLMIRNGGVTVANLSIVFMLAVVLVAPHIAVIGLIISLLLGYRISIDRKNQAFANETFDSVVSTARSNVQNTMQSFSRGFAQDSRNDREAEPERPHSQSAASGTRPVNVRFPGGGQVDVRADDDGYHEADIG